MPSDVVRCPLCKKALSLRGLNGHLRFSHKMSKAEAAKATSQAVSKFGIKKEISNMGKYSRIFKLVDSLEEISNRRKGVARQKDGQSRSYMLGALYNTEQKVAGELADYLGRE